MPPNHAPLPPTLDYLQVPIANRGDSAPAAATVPGPKARWKGLLNLYQKNSSLKRASPQSPDLWKAPSSPGMGADEASSDNFRCAFPDKFTFSTPNYCAMQGHSCC